jgi:tripartite-type tricarboxylate transporter receptor subunit TctC
MSYLNSLCKGAIGLAAGLSMAAAAAADFPVKAINLVVPLQAGGAVDSIARIVAKSMADILGQPVIVDNRPGASNMIGANFVARAPADGYTLLMMSTSLVVQDLVPTQSGNSRLADFAPVGLVGFQPMIFGVHPSVPHATVQEFVAHAKRNPGALNYGTFGSGTTPHLVCELLARELGIKMTPIAYKGSPAVLTDLMAGRIQGFCDVPATSAPLHKAGKIQILGTMGKSRLASLPGVPTFQEAGFADAHAGVVYGLLAPKATPPAVVAALHKALDTALKQPEVAHRIQEIGASVEAQSPEAFAATLRAEREKWKKVIDDGKIQLE